MKKALLLACTVAVCLARGTNSPNLNMVGSQPSQGREYGTDVVVAQVNSTYLGTNYVAELRWPDLDGSPKWAADRIPPLSPQEAETLAREYLEHHIGPPPAPEFSAGTQTWRLSEMALRRWLLRDVWYYELKLVPFLQHSYNNPAVTVFVTMGRRVSPLVKIEGEKGASH
jgi:hypothetical protein